MDTALRTGLWNGLTKCYWSDSSMFHSLNEHAPLRALVEAIWMDHLHRPLDTLNYTWQHAYAEIREHFFGCEWFEVYDFVEFVAGRYPDRKRNETFMGGCNGILKREVSAYRFVGGEIAEMTSEEEVEAIEDSLVATRSIKAVNDHIRRSLELLSDRKSPDYRNSIKESISAVEALCNLIDASGKKSLGACLKIIRTKVNMHPALEKAFNSLYGYTSDENGVRHALMDESELDLEEAKFMLVSCSAFVNFLLAKCSKADIEI